MSSEPNGPKNTANTKDIASASSNGKSVWEAQGRGIAGLVIVIIGLCGRIVLVFMSGSTGLANTDYSTSKETVGLLSLIIIFVGTIFSGVAVVSNNGKTQGILGLLLGGIFLLWIAFQIARFM